MIAHLFVTDRFGRFTTGRLRARLRCGDSERDCIEKIRICLGNLVREINHYAKGVDYRSPAQRAGFYGLMNNTQAEGLLLLFHYRGVKPLRRLFAPPFAFSHLKICAMIALFPCTLFMPRAY